MLSKAGHNREIARARFGGPFPVSDHQVPFCHHHKCRNILESFWRKPRDCWNKASARGQDVPFLSAGISSRETNGSTLLFSPLLTKSDVKSIHQPHNEWPLFFSVLRATCPQVTNCCAFVCLGLKADEYTGCHRHLPE